MTRTLHRAALAALPVALVVAGLPAAATAATGTTTIQPKAVVQDAAHLQFVLPGGYAQVVGAMEGTPAIGSFRRRLPSCNVDLGVSSHITSAPPVRRGTRLTFPQAPGQLTKQPSLRLRRTARTASRTLHLGTPLRRTSAPSTAVQAIAVMRAPADLATKRAKWLVVTASSSFSFCTPQQERQVARDVTDAAWRAARTARVVQGKAQPAPDVPRVPA